MRAPTRQLVGALAALCVLASGGAGASAQALAQGPGQPSAQVSSDRTGAGTSEPTPPGTRILNTAVISYSSTADGSGSSSAPSARTRVTQFASAEITTFVPRPLSIAVGGPAGPGGSSSGEEFTLSSQAGCVRGTTLDASPARFVSRPVIASGETVAFTPLTSMKSGDALFVEIRDDQANRDGREVEVVDVTLTAPSGDVEVVRLAETGPDTGRFIGFVQTSRAASDRGDCMLSVGSNQTITATYLPVSGVFASVQARILVDPRGIVFDSTSGAPLNGALVTLLDDATGLAAQVFGDDGRSAFPNPVRSGASVSDASGVVYPASPGEFRFPLVRPGTYRLIVQPGASSAFPSELGLAELLARFGSQYTLSAASLGAAFAAQSVIAQVDIPVDATGGKLIVSKSASSSAAGIGDFVQYTVSVTNRHTAAVRDVVFTDRLPQGFRLRAESLTVGGVPVAAIVRADGEFSHAIGTLAPGASVAIRYVTEITPLAPVGRAVNLARATGVAAVSNDALAHVQVHDDLLSDRMVVVGYVSEVQSCDLREGRPRGKPVARARILFETGDYAVTDANGAWHMDRLRVGNHVARLDPQSIAPGYEAVLCEEDAHAAGSATSRLVRGTSASLKRVDFHIRRTQASIDAQALALEQMLQAQASGAWAAPSAAAGQASPDARSAIVGAGSAGAVTGAGTQAHTLHDQFVQALMSQGPAQGPATQGLAAQRSILFPTPSFTPVTTAVGVAIGAPLGETVRLFVNGVEVAASSFDGVREVDAAGAAIHYWSAVAIGDGMNQLQARFFRDGQAVETLSQPISFSSNIVSARLEPARSKLVADATNAIEVSFTLIDEFGRPAYRGLSGSYSIEGGFTPLRDRLGGAPAAMLGRSPGARSGMSTSNRTTTFTVGEGGVATIELEPAAKGGEAVVTLHLKDRQIVLRPWIKAARQPWVLVGFAEGSLAQRRIEQGLQRTQGGADLVDTEGRAAFFAKGTIGADLLMTIAYDSRGQAGPAGQGTPTAAPADLGQLTLGGGVTPHAFEVYGDESITQRDAARDGKLYVRIERDRFYAMFGRAQTSLTVTDLTRYERTVSGFTSAYRGQRADLTVFASEVGGRRQAVEVPADALSGTYRAASPIKLDSETVTLVVRSSTQRDRILERRVLDRHLDYDIDHALGLIRLRQPASSHDLGFNPRFVRIEYDTEADVMASTVAGGRIAFRPFRPFAAGHEGAQTAAAEAVEAAGVTAAGNGRDGLSGVEFGLSGVRESGQAGASADHLQGMDVRYQSADGKLLSSLEVATSSRTVDGERVSGSAFDARAQYRGERGSVQLYARQADSGFGLSGGLASDLGIRKIGVEGSLQLAAQSQLVGSSVVQEDLGSIHQPGAGLTRRSHLTEIKLQTQITPRTAGSIGWRTQQVDQPDADLGDVGAATQVPSVQDMTDNDTLVVGLQHQLQGLPVRLMGQVEAPLRPTDAAPLRARLGGEYDLSQSLALVAEHEFSEFAAARLHLSRIGLRARPWKGGQVQASTGVLDGDAAAGTGSAFHRMGLDQSLEIARGLRLELGYARQAWAGGVPSLRVPAGSIASLEDFTSHRLALAYQAGHVIAQLRLEHVDGTEAGRELVQADVYRRLQGGYAVSAGFTSEVVLVGSEHTRSKSVRLGAAHRRLDSPFTGLATLRMNEVDKAGSRASSVVLNLMENYRLGGPDGRWEFFAHQGIKRAEASFDGQGYVGWSYLLNAGMTYHFTPSWTASASALRAGAVSAGVRSQGGAIAIGHVFRRGAFAEIGYQHLDRFDRNLALDSVYTKGVFLRLMVKFDEGSFSGLGLLRNASAASAGASATTTGAAAGSARDDLNQRLP